MACALGFVDRHAAASLQHLIARDRRHLSRRRGCHR
jgi:hypothetical protein